MRPRISVRDSLIVYPRRTAIPALALLALTFGAASAAAVEAVPKPMLEQRVIDVAHMLHADDPRYKKMSEKEVERGVEFVTGNTLFVLGHETAHALIAEMAIPVLGREEDAADALATLVALKMGNAFADRVVVNAARGWFLSDQRDRKDGVPSTFYDEHGMDLQRAYNIVCLLVGGQPDKFMALANEVKLPEARQETCQGDFSNASWSWQQALKAHKRAPDQPKTKIPVVYGPAKGEYAMLSELGQKLQILEAVSDWLSDDYVWKRPISLEMQTCGSPGARWDLEKQKVIVCYEIVAEFSTLYHKYGHAALVPNQMMMAKNKHIVVASKPARSRNQKAFRAPR